MRHFLVVVDMQKDFVDGALGSKEAQAIIPAAVEKIRSFDGELFVTFDTHFEDYLETAEGKKLPVPHCIYGTPGWELNGAIAAAIEEKPHARLQKYTFGSTTLPRLMAEFADGEDFTIELIGLCTDICVVSNAGGFRLLRRGHPRAARSRAGNHEKLPDRRDLISSGKPRV